MIKIEYLKKSFNDNIVLHDVNLQIKKGECVCVIGPSGSGKSTLLRCINLLESPEEGSIEVDGENILDPKTQIDEYRKKVGMVFQHFNLFPNMTVKENIMLAPMHCLKLSRQKCEEKAMALLKMVGLEQKQDVYPGKLSGGQKQRVAIARAIVNEPAMILADEPTGALDTKTSAEIMELFKRLNKEGKTVVIVTHDPKVAEQCSRVIEVSDGKII